MCRCHCPDYCHYECFHYPEPFFVETFVHHQQLYLMYNSKIRVRPDAYWIETILRRKLFISHPLRSKSPPPRLTILFLDFIDKVNGCYDT